MQLAFTAPRSTRWLATTSSWHRRSRVLRVEGFLIARESGQFPARCSGLSRRFSSSEPSNAEIQAQMRELKAICESLCTRVEHLTRTVDSKGHKNLLEVQAVQGRGVCRETFQPTLDMVAIQVNNACQLDSDTLVSLALSGDMYARRERLLREIMLVDKVSWDDAHDRLIEIDVFCEQYYWLQSMPYRIGVFLAVAGAVGSCLLVFNKSLSLSYAVGIAGEELPEGVEDISEMTYNQVGTWTWAWMEPMIGTASFVLLCLQFGRAHCAKMKLNTYTEMMLSWRVNRVAAQFPQYDHAIVRAWTSSMPPVGMNFMPRYRRQMFTPENRRKNFRGLWEGAS
eukprot:TRINITY_DN20000_c1_g1_i1.p1 TRINITY_DN20000_c1_g1~~TRINITY_DN20000_c1_g1_i1.p1  ORF type:complete len:397 (-),score=32.50 TRINITY_DN20000_c1_g1_i1:76-1092(-)